MGSFPHEFSGYRHVSDDATRALFESMWKVQLGSEPGLRIPEHVRGRARRQFPRPLHPGRGFRAVGSEHRARHRGAVGHGMHRHSRHLSQRNVEICACVPAGIFIPGERRHIHQCRTPHFPGTQGTSNPWSGLADWEVTMRLSNCPGLSHELLAPVADHGRDRGAHAHVHRRQLREVRPPGLDPVALQREGAGRARRRCTWARSCAARASST